MRDHQFRVRRVQMPALVAQLLVGRPQLLVQPPHLGSAFFGALLVLLQVVPGTRCSAPTSILVPSAATNTVTATAIDWAIT